MLGENGKLYVGGPSINDDDEPYTILEEFVKIECSKEHRIICGEKVPTLTKLNKILLSSLHVNKGDIVCGKLIQTSEGKWLDMVWTEISPYNHHWIWISDSDKIEKKS